MSVLKDSYKKLITARKKVEDIEKEAKKLKQDTFGEVNAEEDIAKKFFSELAIATEQIKSTEKELQDKNSLLEAAKKEEKEAKDAFLKLLTTMRFPLKLGPEGIEKRGNDIIFNFSEELDKDLFNEINEDLKGECFSSPKVQIETDKIIAKGFDNVSDAMKEVMNHVENKIWKAASGILEIDKYVSELKTRDKKIQRMLYVLFVAGKPLTRKEMETQTNLKAGDLRGVLYLVLNRDPYLKKLERGKFDLTEIGKMLMQRYKEKYGPLLAEETVSSKPLENFNKQEKGDENNE